MCWKKNINSMCWPIEMWSEHCTTNDQSKLYFAKINYLFTIQNPIQPSINQFYLISVLLMTITIKHSQPYLLLGMFNGTVIFQNSRPSFYCMLLCISAFNLSVWVITHWLLNIFMKWFVILPDITQVISGEEWVNHWCSLFSIS